MYISNSTFMFSVKCTCSLSALTSFFNCFTSEANNSVCCTYCHLACRSLSKTWSRWRCRCSSSFRSCNTLEKLQIKKILLQRAIRKQWTTQENNTSCSYSRRTVLNNFANRVCVENESVQSSFLLFLIILVSHRYIMFCVSSELLQRIR